MPRYTFNEKEVMMTWSSLAPSLDEKPWYILIFQWKVNRKSLFLNFYICLIITTLNLYHTRFTTTPEMSSVIRKYQRVVPDLEEVRRDKYKSVYIENAAVITKDRFHIDLYRMVPHWTV